MGFDYFLFINIASYVQKVAYTKVYKVVKGMLKIPRDIFKSIKWFKNVNRRLSKLHTPLLFSILKEISKIDFKNL